ncbi:MAG: hypothetical protein IT562_13650 [Alphaproteobacteria bacterium]|nr:hypothetical protein [Alphaproteobacteria bacterium]
MFALALLTAGFLGTGAVGMAQAQSAPPAAADAAKSQRALLSNLVLLRGRLIAGRELYQFAGNREAALRHLGPNLNSRMAGIEKVVGKDGVKKLQGAVNALNEVAKAGGDFAAFEKAYDAAVEASLRLHRAITDGRLDQPGFVLATIADVVDHAAEDYAAAVKDGKVVVTKEYEEVFGYNLAAVHLWQRVAANHRVATTKRAAAVLEDMERLARAVPSPVPLTALYLTPAEMTKLAQHLRSQAAVQ